MPFDEAWRYRFKLVRTPNRIAVLVDDRRADAFDEIVLGHAGERDTVVLPKAVLNPVELRRVAQIAELHQVTIGTFGHAGDGNLHPTIVFQSSDQASRARAFAAFDQIVRAALELGGTITGEHGVGSLKRDYMAAMVGEAEQALMRRIKACFDPNGILNPGKGF